MSELTVRRLSGWGALPREALRLVLRGNVGYYTWLAFLAGLVAWGVMPYLDQLRHGLVVTNMRDPLSWGLYIGNFTFLVGVAAGSIAIIIPAYVYRWGPVRHMAVFAELMAICTVVMCILFVTVDLGRPDRLWHMFPGVGRLHLPGSLLAWDVLVLGSYLALNAGLVTYMLSCSLRGRAYNERLTHALIVLSIPMAVAIRTASALLYSGMVARPYWNSSMVAPHSLAQAFCSGLAVMIVVFQVLRRTSHLEVEARAIWKMAELLVYATGINLFLQGVELFNEYYGHTRELVHTAYLWQGQGGDTLVPYVWAGLIANLVAFTLLLLPSARRNFLALNLACLLVFWGIYVEKAVAFVAGGFIPSPLGEVYAYAPSLVELRVAAAIFALGLGMFTLLCKVAIPIETGELRVDPDPEPARDSSVPSGPEPVTPASPARESSLPPETGPSDSPAADGLGSGSALATPHGETDSSSGES